MNNKKLIFIIYNMGNIFSSPTKQTVSGTPTASQLNSVQPGAAKIENQQNKSSFFSKLSFKKDWDPQITNEDCLPFNVFLGAVLSRACYDPPVVFALDVNDAYKEIFFNITNPPETSSPTQECRLVGKQKAFTLYLNTKNVAKGINSSFVGNEAKLLTSVDNTDPLPNTSTSPKQNSTESIKPAENVKPTITTKQPVSVKPTESIKPTITTKQPVSVKPTENVKPTITTKQPVSVKPAENVKPTVTTKQPVSVKPTITTKPVGNKKNITQKAGNKKKQTNNVNSRKTKKFRGGKIGMFPSKFYMYSNLLPESKELFKSNNQWAYMYVHTSEDLSCYLIADKITHSIYFLFRGTRSLQNVKTDLKPAAHILCRPDVNVKECEEVFKGVYKLEDEALHTIYYCSVFLMKNFLKATPQNPCSSFCYGHSLGGASATLFAYLWVGIHEEQLKQSNTSANLCHNYINCVSYGSPKVFNSVLNISFEELIISGKIQFIRYVTEGDAITSLPPEANIKKGILNFTLVHPGKNLGEPVNVNKKDKTSNFTLLKCKNPLSNLKAASHLMGAFVKRDRSKLKPISFNYDKPLKCTTINFNPKMDINPNAHGIQARIEYMLVLSNFKAGSELDTGASRMNKIKGKTNKILKVFYSTPGTLDMYGHIFNLKDLMTEPVDKTDNKIISYLKFESLVGKPLMASKNNPNIILQNKLDGVEVMSTQSKSAVENIDENKKPIVMGKVTENVVSSKHFDTFTCLME